jgi:hypothetical protein
VRSAALSPGMLSSVRRAIDAVDPNLAMARVSTLQEGLDRASAGMAFTMVLLTIAAGVALLLGLIGIWRCGWSDRVAPSGGLRPSRTIAC